MIKLISLFLIAIALSLDAFAVALSIGFNKFVKTKEKLYFSVSFGFFQFIFSLIGLITGGLFNRYIACIPNLIGGTIIALVGIFMIKEGFEDEDGGFMHHQRMYFILGISVSIDAMVVGFSVLSSISEAKVIIGYTLIIGIVTFFMTKLAFFIAKHLNRIELICKYSKYIGGVILILFGLRMMLF